MKFVDMPVQLASENIDILFAIPRSWSGGKAKPAILLDTGLCHMFFHPLTPQDCPFSIAGVRVVTPGKKAA